MSARLTTRTLRSAAERDDVVALEAWIAEGVDLSATEDPFLTPLSLFAGAGALGCVELLIETGFALDAGDPPPVLAAALGGHREVLHQLVRAGAELAGGPYHEDYPGPFDAAVEAGNVAAVLLLAEAGAVEASHPETLEDALATALRTKPKVRRAMVVAVVRSLLAAEEIDLGGSAAHRVVGYLAREAKKEPSNELVELAAQAKRVLAGRKAEISEARDAMLESRLGDLFALLEQATARRGLLAGVAAVHAAGCCATFVRAMVPYRPRLDFTGEDGRCALIQAIRTGADLIVGELLLAGAVPHQADAHGKVALDYAREQLEAGHPGGQSMVWKFDRTPLRPPAAIEVRPYSHFFDCPLEGSEPASRAYALVQARKLPEVLRYLDSLRGEDRRGAAGGAVLADCEAGGWTLLEWLLDDGADVNARTDSDWNVVFEAIGSFHMPLALLRRLVEAGATLEGVDVDGNSLLALTRRYLPATHANRIYLEGVMRERGMSVPPERPSWGFEAAQDIAEHDDLGRLEAWLAEGIDFSVPLDMGATLMGATPMTILAGAGAASCVDRLLQVGVSPDEGTPPPVLAAAFGGHRHVLGLLVAAGADLGGEPYDEEFPTPLAAAVAAGDPKAVELLAAAGAVEASSLDTLEAALSHALALEPPKRGVMVPAVVRALAG